MSTSNESVGRTYPFGNIRGVTLMVDAHGDEPSERLTFYKTQTRTIHIGRKSGQTGAKADAQDGDSALFRCPVISRKHAKITFTDFGNAYIIDLNSHHGTYVLRPGELVSSTIKPEVPTVLADGDILTFGKAVGRDDHLVRPVTVRIQLIYGSTPGSPQSIEKTLSTATKDNTADAESTHKPPIPERTGTGRYGVYSSSSDSSNSEHDSSGEEPEEISAYETQYRPMLPMRSGRLALLRRVLPPIHIDPLESMGLCPHVDLPAPCPPLHVPPQTPAQNSAGPGPSDMNNASQASMAPGAWPMSPMEISPVSPGVSAAELQPEQPVDNHDLFDLPFMSPLLSDHPPSPCRSPSPVFSVAASEYEPGTRGNAIDLDSFPSPFTAGAPLFSRETSGDSIVEIVKDGPSTANDKDTAQGMNRLVASMKPAFADRINDTFLDIMVLQNARRKNEELFDTHVQTTKAQISELDKQIHDVKLRVTNSAATTDVQMASVSARLSDLQDEIARVEALSTEAEAPPAPTHDIPQSSHMRAIMEEMKALRTYTQKQVELELEALKAIRFEAEAAAAQMRDEMTAASLKRKRCDTEDDAADTGMGGEVDERRVIRGTKRRKTMEVVSKVVHTAAVAGVGAVAAWAALAFS